MPNPPDNATPKTAAGTIDDYLAAVNSGSAPVIACPTCGHSESAAGKSGLRCPTNPGHGFLVWYATAELATYHCEAGPPS